MRPGQTEEGGGNLRIIIVWEEEGRKGVRISARKRRVRKRA